MYQDIGLAAQMLNSNPEIVKFVKHFMSKLKIYFLKMGGIGAGAFFSPKERADFSVSLFFISGFFILDFSKVFVSSNW